MLDMQAAVLPGQAGLLGGVPEVMPRGTGTTSGRGVWLTLMDTRTIEWVEARRVSIGRWPCWRTAGDWLGKALSRVGWEEYPSAMLVQLRSPGGGCRARL